MALNIQKLDELIQYILAVASQYDYLSRELGKIHLIKYVYLTDLAYAKYHNEETYTGLSWNFHNFGPWAVECFKRIDPALEAIGAHRKVIESDKYDDRIRWYIDDGNIFDRLEAQMGLSVSAAVQRYVREFGNDTYGLLDYVYKTPPMLKAAPEETLDFKYAIAETQETEIEENKPELTARQKKIRRKKILAFKKSLNQMLKEKTMARKASSCPKPPRYDDIFFEGLERLDESAGTHPVEGDYLGFFTDDIWKSKARHDPELS